MFNLGFSEVIILGVLALLLIGPKQLPELARTLGRLLNEFKRATGDITSVVTDFKHSGEKMLRDFDEEPKTTKPQREAVAAATEKKHE